MQSSIQLLPEHIIDQIKAGEVIERPSSLIKELIENSLDAGANLIQIHVVEQGLKLIEVTDNGHGMSYDDLPFAFCRHATSKISNFEDLYHLYTYGFRGEALASMASISKITCIAHTKNGDGGKIIINGGLTELHIKDDSKISGTSFFVRDLFFNTPVRLKFIKSKNSEQLAIKKIIEAFLLSYPHIEFHVRFDDKDKDIYKAYEVTENFKRILDVFETNGTKNFSDNLKIELKKQYLQNTINLFMVAESALKSSQKFQFIFVNKRLVQDRQIHAIITSFAEAINPEVRFTNYCLFINVPPEDLDANVHPNKTFVKFTNFGSIIGLITASLKSLVESNKVQTEEIVPLFPIRFHDLNTTSDPLFETAFTQNYSITDSVILVQKNNLFYLIHIIKALTNYIEEQVTKPYDSTPLLISEPFPLKKDFDTLLTTLIPHGFEFDRLSDHSVVLRGLPEWMTPLNFKGFLHEFFSWSTNHSIKKENHPFLYFLKNASPLNFFDSKTKSFLIQEFMEQNKFQDQVVCLDADLVTKLFKP